MLHTVFVTIFVQYKLYQCEASHQTAEFFAHTQTGLRALDVDMST